MGHYNSTNPLIVNTLRSSADIRNVVLSRCQRFSRVLTKDNISGTIHSTTLVPVFILIISRAVFKCGLHCLNASE